MSDSDEKPTVQVLGRGSDGKWAPAEPEEPGGVVYEYIRASGRAMSLTEALSGLLGLPLGVPEEVDGVGEGTPDISVTVDEGLAALGVPRAVWTHHRTLTHVVWDGTTSVGFRNSQFNVPFRGPRWSVMDRLVEGLRAKMQVH